MLGSHLNDLSSCLVDEDCTILDRVGSACVDGFVLLSFFFKNKKECRHQHVHWVETGGVQDFDIAFKGRPGEVGWYEGSGGELAWKARSHLLD